MTTRTNARIHPRTDERTRATTKRKAQLITRKASRLSREEFLCSVCSHTTLQPFMFKGKRGLLLFMFLATMNNASGETIKEVQSQLPQETAVAVELRKLKERDAEKQDYGRTDKPQVTVTCRADKDSDTDDATIKLGGNSDSDGEFSDMNSDAGDGALGDVDVRLNKIQLDKKDAADPSAVADTPKETEIVVMPPAVADTAKKVEIVVTHPTAAGSVEEICVEDTAAAVAEDRKDDEPTAVLKKRKTDTTPVEPLTKQDIADLAPEPTQPSSDFCASDSSEDPGRWRRADKAKSASPEIYAVPEAETKDVTRTKAFLKPNCKSKGRAGNKHQPVRSRSRRRNRSRSWRRNRSRSGRSNSSRSRRSNNSRSGSRNRSRGRRRSGSRNGRGRATTVGRVAPVATEKLSRHDGLDRHLIPRAAQACAPRPDPAMPGDEDSAMSDGELAPSVACNLMISQWIVGKKTDVIEFADKMIVCPMDVVCVALAKSVNSKDDIYKFLEHLANETQRDDTLIRPSSRRNDSFKASEVLQEKIVLYLRSDVWIVVNRCKVEKVSFIESDYRSSGKQPSVAFGFVRLKMNRSRSRGRMPDINIGVLNAHKAVCNAERQMLSQWLTVKKIAVLCGFYQKGPNGRNLASALGANAGAVGEAPCAQAVSVKNKLGRAETKTHPSFIMCFGYCWRMRWPDHATYVSNSFLGDDVEKELVTVAQQNMPSWEQNWIGSERVPHLGNINQKYPNLNMWCRNSFQNCVWLGAAIPSKQKHRAWAHREDDVNRQAQQNIYISRDASTAYPLWGHCIN